MSEDKVYKVSAHRLNMYKQCPYKHFLYLLGVRVPIENTEHINAGSAVHGFMEDFIQGKAKDKEYYIKEFDVPPSTYEKALSCMITGEQMFEGVKGRCEKTIIKEITTPKGNKARVEARLDLITDEEHPRIVDYKTSKHVITPDYTLQMKLYMFATDYKYPAECVSLRTGSVMRVDSCPHNYIPLLCDEYIENIKSNKFERREGWYCQFCEYYKDYCAPDTRWHNPMDDVESMGDLE